MEKTLMMKEAMISDERLEMVSGGFPGLIVPGIPDTPYVTVPGEPDDEPKDGGVTFTW